MIHKQNKLIEIRTNLIEKLHILLLTRLGITTILVHEPSSSKEDKDLPLTQ